MHTATFKSAVIKRSVRVAGHKTSVSLEDAFWRGLKAIAGEHHVPLSDLIDRIDSGRQHTNLSSAIRLFVLDFYREQREVDRDASAPNDLTIAVVASPPTPSLAANGGDSSARR
jgi:predicted DNA-binding ribbon-helix-helix protein